MPERLSRELRVLYELAHAVAAGPYELDDILVRICDEIRADFGFDRALLARYRPEDRTVHAVVLQGVEWPGDEWLPLDRFPLLERALETRGAVLARDAGAEKALPGKLVERFGVRSIAAAPLLVEGRVLGFLVADRGGEAFDFAPGELELLTALGWIAAVFIEKAEQYAQLQEALEELWRLDRAKSEFVSIASHELRTPIAVVHGIASTLHARGGELPEEQLAELRRALYTQTSRLRGLAEQLLDLSRLEAGAYPFAPCPIRPRERLEQLLPDVATGRLREIELAVDPEVEITTDPDGFERVAANLVTNAIRYGRPPISIRADVDEEFRLVVEDRGDGVAPEFVPRLFERFTRSDRSRRRADGAGLGLAIAHSFACALGGDLRYEPATPHGARFILVLPRAA
jgi:two-component system, OmpR family, sensor histidine kinase MtrB